MQHGFLGIRIRIHVVVEERVRSKGKRMMSALSAMLVTRVEPSYRVGQGSNSEHIGERERLLTSILLRLSASLWLRTLQQRHEMLP